MVGAAIAVQETFRGCEHAQAGTAVNGGTFRIDDTAIVTGHLFARHGFVDRSASVHLPWVIQVQFRNITGQLVRRRQPRMLVSFGVARNGRGRFQGVTQAVAIVVRAARMSLAQPLEHGDRNASVAVKLDRFHLALPHVDRKALTEADIHLNPVQPQPFSLFQHPGSGILRLLKLCHVECRCRCGGIRHKIALPLPINSSEVR